MFCRNTTAGRSACLSSLKLLAVWNTATDILDDGTKCRTHRNFYKTCIVDLTIDSEYLCTFGLLCTHGSKPFSTIQDDLWNIRISLNIVQDSRACEKTFNSREWRSWSWFASVAFDGCHKGCFLTTDESTCTKSEINIKIKS